jgi:hypothetical protein
VTALVAKALAVLASGSWSWLPVPAPDRTPIRDPFPRHHRRPKPDPPPMSTAVASWYDQSGIGACGTDAQTGLRFASLILACGQRIRICHAGCVTATMADHGPYVAGRTFDLNVNLRNAIGCGDLCTVRWRLA